MADRSARWALVAGFGLVACFVGEAVTAGSSPSGNTAPTAVVRYYSTHHGRVEIGEYFLLLAVVFGLFFFGFLYDRVRNAADAPWLAATLLGGGVVLAMSGGIGAGASLALAAESARLALPAAQALNLTQNYAAAYVANAGAAALLIALAIAILRTRLLPRWLGWVAALLGVVAVLPVPTIGALAAAVWTLACCVGLTLRSDMILPRPGLSAS